jgi:hypothetical protein
MVIKNTKPVSFLSRIKAYKLGASFVAALLIIGLAGNLFYEDDVVQHNSNCASATYVNDNPESCGE